jgi:hypothetical protein
MPNPVAVNDLQPISGSLQTSRISYGVETANKNYGQNYNSTTWYSDIPQNGSQYTIISDNYTANYYISRSNAEGAYVEGGLPAVDEYSAPVFWMTVGTSSLDIITIVNGLPDRRGQIPFNSGSQALNWIASSSNYFAVGPPFEQIDADQLALYLDASQVISYPTTASTWYDISGNTKNGTLVNGPTFNSNGWINFDGVDDEVNVSTVVLSGDFSITQIMNITTTNNGPMPIGGGLFTNGTNYRGYVWFRNSENEVRFKVNGETGPDFSVLSSKWANKWISYTVTRNGDVGKLYINGIEEGSSTMSTNDFDVRSIGWGYNTFYLTTGSISKTLISNKALSTTEIFQNYYGGPVVTGSISGSYYANNLVSYVTGSTAAYNLSANIISGSLQNGVGFSPLNGGFWSFDGTDDLILLEGSTQNAWILNSGDTWTVNAWVRTPSGSFGSAVDGGYYYGPILSNTSGGPIYSTFQINGGTIAYTHYNGGWLTKYGTTVVNDGNWHMLTWINESNNITFYVDNIPNGTFNSTITGVGWLDNIGSAVGNYFIGDIASVQINKGKAFTAAEVLQQYNATK